MKVGGYWFFQKYYQSCTFCPKWYQIDQHDEIYWFSLPWFSSCDKVLQECFLYCTLAIHIAKVYGKRKTKNLENRSCNLKDLFIGNFPTQDSQTVLDFLYNFHKGCNFFRPIFCNVWDRIITESNPNVQPEGKKVLTRSASPESVRC